MVRRFPEFDAASNGTAPHKHVFSAARFDGAFVLKAVRNTLDVYGDFGVPLPLVFCACVLYHHDAIALAFNDAMWEKYAIPYGRKFPKSSAAGADFASIYDGSGHGNPMLHAVSPHDDSLESLVADGSRFFVCDNALRNYASYVATEFGGNPAGVYGDLANNLVNGAALVPAGVWAIHVLQERHFTLLQTSV
jgi:intracellular sulfur oxidation DsrE/DsrF family protein